MRTVRFFTRSVMRSRRNKEAGWVVYYVIY